MARPNWKANYISKRLLRSMRLRIQHDVTKYLSFLHCYTILQNFEKTLNYTHLLYTLKNIHILRTYHKAILYPRNNDTILRFYSCVLTWQHLTYGYVDDRFTWGGVAEWMYQKKYYFTHKEMSGQKFGGFLITRRSGGFRTNVDFKKLDKLSRDLEKFEKKKKHHKKESARLLKKAILETKAKNAKRAHKTTGKKKK